MFSSASNAEMFASIPVNEKSNIPSTRKALHPSSRAIVFFGTSSVRQTTEFSSSVFAVKQYSASNSLQKSQRPYIL